ncbi:hypothetical protein Tco_1246163 [Tanacetum coccineum]
MVSIIATNYKFKEGFRVHQKFVARNKEAAELREEWYDIDGFRKVRLEWKLVLPMVDYYCLLKFDSITTASILYA